MSTFFKDSTLSLIGRVFVLGAAMLTSVLISRTLGASLQGTYNVFVLIINTTTAIFSLSASIASIILGAREPERLPQLFGNALLIALGTAVLAIVIVILCLQIPAVRVYFQDNGIETPMAVALLFMLPVIMFSSFVREIIRAAGHIGRYNLVTTLPYLLNFVFLLIAIFLQPGILGPAIIAWIVAQITTTLVTIYLAWQAANFHLGLDFKLIRFSLSYGIRGHLALVTQMLNYRLDIFLVGVFLPTEYIGFYTIASLYAERIWEFPIAVRTALLYHVSANLADAPRFTAQATRVTMVFVTLATLGMALVAYPFIIIVHGASFQPAALSLILLMPGVWMLSLGKMLVVYLASINRPDIGTYAGIISLIFTIILDLWLIPRIGIPGAALASSTSYTVSTLVIMWYFLRITQLSWRDVSVVRRSDIDLLRRAVTRVMHPDARSFESNV